MGTFSASPPGSFEACQSCPRNIHKWPKFGLPVIYWLAWKWNKGLASLFAGDVNSTAEPIKPGKESLGGFQQRVDTENRRQIAQQKIAHDQIFSSASPASAFWAGSSFAKRDFDVTITHEVWRVLQFYLKKYDVRLRTHRGQWSRGLLLPIVGYCRTYQVLPHSITKYCRTYQPWLPSIAGHHCHYCWLLLNPLLCPVTASNTIIVGYYCHNYIFGKWLQIIV